MTAQEIFQNHLRDRDLRFTAEREGILSNVLSLTQHFDADELYEDLRSKGLRISRDTVYRTIPLLLECGIIQKSVGKSKRDYFEVAEEGHHDHMVCLCCSKVIEFHSEQIEQLQIKICKKVEFEMVFHDHKLVGYCRDCKNKKGVKREK